MAKTLHSLPNELILDILGLLASSPGHLPYDLPALITASSKCARMYFAHRDEVLRTALQTFLGNFVALAGLVTLEELPHLSDTGKTEASAQVLEAFRSRHVPIETLPKASELPLDVLLLVSRIHRYHLETIVLLAYSYFAMEQADVSPISLHPQLRTAVPLLCELILQGSNMATSSSSIDDDGLASHFRIDTAEVIDAYAFQLMLYPARASYLSALDGSDRRTDSGSDSGFAIIDGHTMRIFQLCHDTYMGLDMEFPESFDPKEWNSFGKWLDGTLVWYVRRVEDRNGQNRPVEDLTEYLFFGPGSGLVDFRKFLVMDEKGRNEWVERRLAEMPEDT